MKNVVRKRVHALGDIDMNFGLHTERGLNCEVLG